MLERIKEFLHITKRENNSPSIFEKIDAMFTDLDEPALTVLIGEDLVELNEDIRELIHRVREEIASECGFIFPVCTVREALYLQENEFAIKIFGEQAENSFVVPNKDGIKELYEKLKDVIYLNIDKLFTNDYVEKYIDTVQKQNGWLIYSLINCHTLSSCEIKVILTDLIKKGHSIKNINHIFEKIGEKVLVNHKYEYNNPHKISAEIIKELSA